MRLQLALGLGSSRARGGGGFSPSKIAGMVAWFDAADINLDNNDPVSVWENRIVGNGDLTQNVAIRQPAYLTNGQNGLPVVRFGKVGDDATNADFMESGNFGITGAYTIIVAGSFEGRLSGTLRAYIFWSYYKQLMARQDSGLLGGYIIDTLPSPPGDISAPCVVSGRWDGSNYVLAKNVDFGDSIEIDATLLATSNTWGGESNTRHLLGSMYEICVYSRALSTGPGSEHESVVNYLKTKWGME